MYIKSKTIIQIFILLLASVVFISCEKTRTVKITQSKAFEIVPSKWVDKYRETFFKDYFPKVMPIITEYGGSFEMIFDVVDADAKGTVGQIDYMHWATAQKFAEIVRDPRIPPLLEIRKPCFSYISEGNFLDIDGDKELKFSSNKFYQIINGFSADNKNINATLKNTTSTLKSLGGIIMMDYTLSKENTPYRPEYGIGTYRPDWGIIVEWPDKKSYKKAIQSIEYKKAVENSKRIDTYLTTFVFF